MTDGAGAAIRSWLYVPADQPGKVAGAADRGADAVILDLEDGVAPAHRESAREQAVDHLRDRGTSATGGPAVWVRVNNDAGLVADLEAVVGAGADGVVLPKADLASMDRVSEALGGRDVALAPLIETARGFLEAATLATCPGVTRLAVGEVDLAADLGLDPSPDAREFQPLRSHVVVASAAAGLEPPCGPVSTDFRDLDAFRASTEALRRAGFGSRSAIHPAQVTVINEVFTPSEDEVEQAAARIDAFESAAARGQGVTVDGDGRMVDEAVIRAARRTLARARRPEPPSGP